MKETLVVAAIPWPQYLREQINEQTNRQTASSRKAPTLWRGLNENKAEQTVVSGTTYLALIRHVALLNSTWRHSVPCGIFCPK